MQQEASQRATNGLQPERSDTEEFQAEGRQGGKVPGGREGGRRRTRRAGRTCGLLSKEEHTLKAVSLWLNINI